MLQENLLKVEVQKGLEVIFKSPKMRTALAMNVLSLLTLTVLLGGAFLITVISIGLNFFQRSEQSPQPVAGSSRATPRHIDKNAYGCSRQGLTRFTPSYLLGPDRHHCFPVECFGRKRPRKGIDPAIADCRLQGTATSPSSAAIVFMTLLYTRSILTRVR